MPAASPFAVAALAASLALPCLAGRPLLVEDAGVNEAGEGHVEAWFERDADGGRLWTVAPAFSPWHGIEFALSRSRDTRSRTDGTGLTGKWQITEEKEDGCNHAVVLGLSHASDEDGSTRFVNGVMTCGIAPGALHLNLFASRPRLGPTQPGFGAAWEQPFGAITGHVEWVAQRSAKPILNLGMRGDVVDKVQLDGSIGRSGGRMLFSVGMKLQF